MVVLTDSLSFSSTDKELSILTILTLLLHTSVVHLGGEGGEYPPLEIATIIQYKVPENAPEAVSDSIKSNFLGEHAPRPP